jgi:hypothetical protein
MTTMIRVVPLAACVTVAGCATTPDPIHWTKAGYTPEGYRRDVAACQMEMDRSWLGGSNTGGWLGARARVDTAHDLAVACMESKGWVRG